MGFVIYNDEVQDLAVAIAQQAIEDYWKASAKHKALIKKMTYCSAEERKKYEEARWDEKLMIWDCVSFFVDPWFETLMGFPFEKIADRVANENPYVAAIRKDKNGVEKIHIKKRVAPTLICDVD